MDNYQIADVFTLLGKVMDIHGENPFKIKSYSNAAFQIERLTTPLVDMKSADIAALRGVGDTIAKKIQEIIETGTLSALQQYLNQTPPGVLDMLHIKGLGPKKINTVWKEMEIESLGELLYACNENRLTRYKGFGEKTQKNIQEAIEFYLSQQGNFLFQQAEALALPLHAQLQSWMPGIQLSFTGEFRRHSEVVDKIEWVVAADASRVEVLLQEHTGLPVTRIDAQSLSVHPEQYPECVFYCTTPEAFAHTLFCTTGAAAFLEAFPENALAEKHGESEEAIFVQAGIPFIPPYLRETATIINQVQQQGTLPDIITVDNIRGIIHSHSTWSDGNDSIEVMARAAQAKGFEYLVISDHSKTAAYANGLSVERIRAQHAEIDALNAQLAPFRIFKSIESDILGDGSLDYDEEILATFDLVIASVHANLKMSEEKAMQRLMGAIEHPRTTILGHPTGRLLISRNGYPIDHRRIIDACVANHVAIELNAHPRRLDLDWRWIGYALERGAIISINPDAHAVEGFDDIRYGVLAAQKGMLPPECNLSSFSLPAFEAYLAAVKLAKG